MVEARSLARGAERLRSALLLLVPLHRPLAAGGRLRGVPPRVAEGPALPQQVPADVEASFHLQQPGALLLGQPTADVSLVQPMLLGGQAVDALKQVFVVHRLTPYRILVCRAPDTGDNDAPRAATERPSGSIRLP